MAHHNNNSYGNMEIATLFTLQAKEVPCYKDFIEVYKYNGTAQEDLSKFSVANSSEVLLATPTAITEKLRLYSVYKVEEPDIKGLFHRDPYQRKTKKYFFALEPALKEILEVPIREEFQDHLLMLRSELKLIRNELEETSDKLLEEKEKYRKFRARVEEFSSLPWWVKPFRFRSFINSI